MNDWGTLMRLLVVIQANLDQDAVTTHAGAHDPLGAAYAKIFPRVAAFRDYDLVGLPALEVYPAARIKVRLALNHTDIGLPLRGKSVP